MEEEKTFHKSERKRLLGFGAVCGAIVCTAVYAVLYFGGIFIGGLALVSLHKTALSISAGVFAAVLSVLLHRTSVEVGSDGVKVKRAGVNVYCSASERIEPRSEISSSAVEMLKVASYKCGLKLNGRYVRLYGFGENAFERLANDIRRMQAENIPLEGKISSETQSMYEPIVLLSVDGSDGSYFVPHEKIIHEEKKLIGKIAAISIAIAAVLAFIGLDGAGFKEMIALIIAACMAVSCPFLLIGCFKRAKLFPKKLR